MASETILDKLGIDIVHGRSSVRTGNEQGFKFDSAVLKKIMLSTPNVLYIHDLNPDNYHFPNNHLEEILGYEKGAFRTMSKKLLTDLMHPDDYKRYDEFIGRILKSRNNRFFISEYRMKTKSGDWRWFLSKETVYERDRENNVSKILGIATDITNLKSAQVKSRESRANLEALIESTSDIIYSIDREFRIITMNSECRRNFASNTGIEPTEGLYIMTGLDEARINYFSGLFNRVLTGERVNYSYDFRVDNKIKHLEVTLNPVYSEDGTVTAISCFGKDVSNFKIAENKFREQNILLNSILESTHSSIFAFDLEGRYIAFNSLHKKTIKEIFGVDIEIGIDWRDFVIDTADYEKSIRNWERCLEGESFSIVTEYGLNFPDRQVYEIFYSPILDEKNTITGVSLYSKDVTEKIKNQQELFSAERRFRDVFENSPDAIFVEDFAGNILDLNNAALSLQGMPKEQLVGFNIRKLVPKEKYVKVLRDYKQLFFGIIKTLESSVWSMHRGEIPVEITGKKIRYGNKEVFLLNVRDISERKKIEAERAQIMIEKSRQKEELIKTSIRIQEEERNRIAAEMHDEIGAGLSKISILSQVVRKSFNDPETVSTNIEKILQASKEVQENISEIIWAMDPKNDTVENLVAYVNYYTSELLDTSDIKLSMNFPVKIPAVTLSGKTRRNTFLIIKESLTNIVKHARATHVKMEIQFEKNVLSFLVADNGNGFDMNCIPRFKNGLCNMKKRIAEVGGTCAIDSAPGKGTAIQLHIPVPVS